MFDEGTFYFDDDDDDDDDDICDADNGGVGGHPCRITWRKVALYTLSSRPQIGPA